MKRKQQEMQKRKKGDDDDENDSDDVRTLIFLICFCRKMHLRQKENESKEESAHQKVLKSHVRLSLYHCSRSIGGDVSRSREY